MGIGHGRWRVVHSIHFPSLNLLHSAYYNFLVLNVSSYTSLQVGSPSVHGAIVGGLKEMHASWQHRSQETEGQMAA